MIDVIVKIAVSLFVGGIGLGLLLLFTVLFIILIQELKNNW